LVAYSLISASLTSGVIDIGMILRDNGFRNIVPATGRSRDVVQQGRDRDRPTG
jgi:hypothetical protein